MFSLGLIRAQTQNLLTQFDVSQPPVPVEEIAEGCLLKVVEVDRQDLEDGVLKPELQTIELRRGKPLTARRFTIAHELGHWILFHKNLLLDLPEELSGIYDNRTDEEVFDTLSSPTNREPEANRFAAELLMPLNWVKSDWKITGDPKALARIYQVSEQAMWIRLLSLHLIR